MSFPPFATSSTISDDLRLMADGIWNFEHRIREKIPIGHTDALLSREIHVKHVAWKFNERCNEIWIDGVLGVVFTPNQKNEGGTNGTRVNYSLDNGHFSKRKDTFFEMDLSDLARWHLVWLTDPAVFIDSATIDMEFDPRLMTEKRNFRISHLNINVLTNFGSINGWLQYMDANMESFIFRGNGILDANRLLAYSFTSHLKKLMIIYESSFDDRSVNMLNATHIQLASDFITDTGINSLLRRWNDQDYPIRSSFVIYMTIDRPKIVVANLHVLSTKKDEFNGVTEYLIEMTNTSKRMRVILRHSSIICTIFAVTNLMILADTNSTD